MTSVGTPCNQVHQLKTTSASLWARTLGRGKPGESAWGGNLYRRVHLQDGEPRGSVSSVGEPLLWFPRPPLPRRGHSRKPESPPRPEVRSAH